MKQEINYRILLDKIELPVVICNMHGKIHVYNKKASELFQMLFKGTDFNETCFNAEQFFSLGESVAEIIKSGLSRLHKKFVLNHKEKGQIIFLLSCFKINNQINKPEEIIVAINDITEDTIFNDLLSSATKNVESVIYSLTPEANKFLL